MKIIMKTICAFVMLNIICLENTCFASSVNKNAYKDIITGKTLAKKQKMGPITDQFVYKTGLEEKIDFEKVEKKENTMENIKNFEYIVKSELKPSGLIGISDNQINDHWKLYEGYVKQVNTLNAELKKMAQEGKTQDLVYADRRRRYGFEYNGMILHEYYFGNLKGLDQAVSPSKELLKAIESTWGSFDKWKEDFAATGKTRGIGWAILYLDPKNMQLTNHFIAEHQDGVITDFKPILVMDVWEHAYMVDHSATERAKYIDAFLGNINWSIVNNRFMAFIGNEK